MRLVSLLPSATEIVYALGLGDDLVGVTFECDEPAVGAGGQDRGGRRPGHQRDGAGRDRRIRAGAARRRRGPLHAARRRPRRARPGADPDPGPVPGLRAAVRSRRGRAGLSRLPGRRAVPRPALARRGARHDPRRSASGPGCRTGPSGWSPALRARLDAVAAAVGGRPRPRVAVVEWVDPPFTAGPLGAGPGDGGRRRAGGRASGRAVASRRPGPRSSPPQPGRGRGVAVRLPPGRRGRAGPAVAPRFPAAAVWAIDADGIVVRPGPRLVDGVEALAAILHPGTVPDRPGTVTRVA